MYEDHYGLTTRPFQLTPDPRFWVETATHRKAMAYLGYGLAQGEGFIVITGDIGAGKTTLVGHLMETIDRDRLHVVKLVSTQVEPEDLLRTVAEGMGAATAALTKSDLLGTIERQLHALARTGKRTLLVVDEVQALPTASLEELRMLSNFQAAGHALLQIVLLGQPEFRERLVDPALEQLRQRVIATHHLEPMGADEVELYVAQRLTIAGWRGRPDFDTPALAAMHGWSGGIPRRLNQLASRVLLHGALERIDAFGADDIAVVIADLDGDMPTPARPVAVETTVEAPSPVSEWPVTPRPIVADSEPVVLAPAIQPDPPVTEAVPVADDTGPFVQPMDEEQVHDDAVATDEPGTDESADDALIAADIDLTDRLAAIERRLEEQDAALRRVLTLLVDWFESDSARRPEMSGLRDDAA